MFGCINSTLYPIIVEVLCFVLLLIVFGRVSLCSHHASTDVLTFVYFFD